MSWHSLLTVWQPPPPPPLGGRLSPISLICSADLLGLWVLPICFAKLFGFPGHLRRKRGRMVLDVDHLIWVIVDFMSFYIYCSD